MIVLAILSVISLIAWPRVTGKLPLLGLREAANQFRADLAETRDEAIRSGTPWAVRVEKGSGRYEFGPVPVFRDRDRTRSSRRVVGELAFPPTSKPVERKVPTDVRTPIQHDPNRAAEETLTSPSEPLREQATVKNHAAGYQTPGIETRELPPDIVFEGNPPTLLPAGNVDQGRQQVFPGAGSAHVTHTQV